MISENPEKLRGDGGGAVSFDPPFAILGAVVFELVSPVLRSFAMSPRGYRDDLHSEMPARDSSNSGLLEEQTLAPTKFYGIAESGEA